tara:strand:+ start:393 stop:623 length:231 start_codon:yes stop_codon:yes gene_type:complete
MITIKKTLCVDSTAVLKDTSGTTISTTPIASGASADITTPDVKMYGVTFDGFTYDVTWEDADIEIFVANEMKKHEV